MATARNDGIDLRYLFLRGLVDHEINQRSRHYLKSAAECTSRAIVSLELSQQPLISVKQARRLEGIGGETCTRLSKLFEERNFSSLKPLPGRFVSSAGAILVTLLDLTNDSLVHRSSTAKDILVPEDKVRERAKMLCEEPFREEDKEGFCVAWWRLEVLIKRGFVKRRSQKKIPVLQLLPKGTEIAQRLKGPTNLMENQNPRTSEEVETENQNTVGAGDVPCVSQNGSLKNQLYKPGGKSLFTNDNGEDGVVLLVDTQEMGGERVGLGELCRLLDQNGVCFRTRKLRTGDYGWCWRRGGTEVVLPCLVERKRADDIPYTLKEGRFWSQINRMLEWKKDFTGRGIDCNIHYILERKPEEFVVKCVDGCQGIGQCGNPTLPQIKMVIEDLKQHPELLVKETGSLEVTAVLLKSLTNELTERAEKGDFDILLTQATRESIVKNKTDQGLDSAELELTYEEQLRLAKANSLKDREKHHNGNTVLPEDEDLKSSRKTLCILEKDKSELVPNRDKDLTDEEELKFVEENSLNDVKHYSGNSIELLKRKESLENFARSVSKRPCISASYPNNEPTSNIAYSDAFLSKPQTDNTLLQHHYRVESSKICDSQLEHEEKERADDQICGGINNKRSYVSSSLFTEGLVNEFDQADTHTVSKRPKINNAREESVLDLACSNSVHVLESLGETVTATTSDHHVHTNEYNESEVYKDKTDDILDSLRCSLNRKSAHMEVKETISIIDDEIAEIKEHRRKVKLKPIKLNVSPSKLFVEPNIPRVSLEKKRDKRKSASKVKREVEVNLGGTDDDVNRVSMPDEVYKSWNNGGTSEHRKETVIYSREKHVDSLCDAEIRNKSQIECRDTALDNDTRSVTYDCDTDSNQSIKDIFADTPSKADFGSSNSFTKETMNVNDSNKKDIEVGKWLTNCDVSDEVSYIAEIDKRHQCYTVREDSDDSLPDIDANRADFGNKLDSAVDLDKHELDDVIDITEDTCNSIFTVPVQSGARRRSKSQVNKKTRRKGRNGNDSGYESGDIRGQQGTNRTDIRELDTKIETVLAILPHIHRDKVIEMLQKYGQDVERSITELLDQGDDGDHPETSFIDLTD